MCVVLCMRVRSRISLPINSCVTCAYDGARPLQYADIRSLNLKQSIERMTLRFLKDPQILFSHTHNFDEVAVFRLLAFLLAQFGRPRVIGQPFYLAFVP